MKLRFINTHALFPTAGLISTVASVSGVFSYLMVENNADTLLSIGGFMSVGGAVGLGLCIYFGWEVAFNHKGIAKRLAAGLIASSAATLSGYTLYQNAAHPILEQAHTAQLQQQTRTLQQQDSAAALLQQQQADLRVQMEDLRQQNKADTASISTLEVSDKKGVTWQVAQLRKAIEVRTADITALSARIESYTQRLTAAPVTKADNAGSESNDGNAPAQQPAVLSWAMLARASMYEVMTALFLLFGSWYRANRRETENAQATQLHNVTVQAHNALHDLQTATQVLVGVIAQATTVADALEAGQANTRRLLTEVAEQLESIRTKAIEGATLIQQQARSSEQLQAETAQMQTLLATSSETVDSLQQVVAPATTLLQDLKNMTITCNAAIAGAKETANKPFAHANTSFTHANETANTSFACVNGDANADKKELDQNSAIYLIENRIISSTNEDNLTPDVVMAATGWGRPRAIQLLELAWKQGSLDRKQAGRGWTYCYPSEQQTVQQLDLTNVVQLPARNA